MLFEQVLVVKTEILIDYIDNFDSNLIRQNKHKIYQLLIDNHFFLERKLAEPDPSHRQIIPYITIKYQDDYFLLNCLIKHPVWKEHGYIYAGCENILDEDYEESYGYPMPDRMFFGGIEIKF